MNTLAPSFLIRSSSFLQVTRTCIKASMSSNFGQIPKPTPVICPWASEKLMYNVLNTLVPLFLIRSVSYFILAGNEDIYNIPDEFEIRPDSTKDCGVRCPLASGKIPIDL